MWVYLKICSVAAWKQRTIMFKLETWPPGSQVFFGDMVCISIYFPFYFFSFAKNRLDKHKQCSSWRLGNHSRNPKKSWWKNCDNRSRTASLPRSRPWARIDTWPVFPHWLFRRRSPGRKIRTVVNSLNMNFHITFLWSWHCPCFHLPSTHFLFIANFKNINAFSIWIFFCINYSHHTNKQ